jgi:hypothetical protein
MEEHHLDKLAYLIPKLAEAVDLSVTTLREEIAKNNLIVSYPTAVGKKPIVTRKNAEAWLDSLPVESPRERQLPSMPEGSEASRRSYFRKLKPF